MQIRTKLTLQFLTFGALILFFSFTAIYFFSVDHRQEDFYSRIQNKAMNTAKMLVDMDEVDAGLLKRIETDNPIRLPEEKILVLSHSDSLIYTTDDDQSIQVSDALISKIRLEELVRYKQDEFQVVGLIYQGKKETILVIAAAKDIYGYRKIANLLNVLGIVFLFSLLVLLAAGWFYSGRALKPISKVVTRVDEISISSLNLRVDEGNGQDEIAKLAGTFNKMLDRLETAFTMQKNFIANASHELRNPLTAISGQLEVLMMRKRSPEEYEKAVSSVLEDMNSLNDLSNRLLQLAQASTGGQNNRFKPVRIDEILWQAKDELLKRNKHYQVQIRIDPAIEEERDLTILGDAQLTKSALMNLMDNGCKYSGRQEVLVEVCGGNHQLSITFTDHGIGIPEADMAHLFEPFHRGTNVLNTKGYGIGLSLAGRVVEMQGGAITIQSGVDEGTTITITFPLA